MIIFVFYSVYKSTHNSITADDWRLFTLNSQCLLLFVYLRYASQACWSCESSSYNWLCPIERLFVSMWMFAALNTPSCDGVLEMLCFTSSSIGANRSPPRFTLDLDLHCVLSREKADVSACRAHLVLIFLHSSPTYATHESSILPLSLTDESVSRKCCCHL